MIAFEVALVICVAIILVTAIRSLARPITEAIAERMRSQYREMGSDTEKMLKDRVNFLEGELLAVKQQVTALQEQLDYVGKQVESQGSTIKVPDQQQR
jgi:flagellar biosynthesis/type III secretory pathway M-ring protein FliF/YscJ